MNRVERVLLLVDDDTLAAEELLALGVTRQDCDDAIGVLLLVRDLAAVTMRQIVLGFIHDLAADEA